MCGTEQSKEIDDFNESPFKNAGKQLGLGWRMDSRIDYELVDKLEGHRVDPNDQKNRPLNSDFFSDVEKSTVASVRSKREKVGSWSRGDGPMTVGADPYLKKNDILASLEGLERTDDNYGKVRFESTENKTSTSSKDLLDICQATNSRIFASGPDDEYKNQASGGLFKDQEFPPDQSSIQGFHSSPYDFYFSKLISNFLFAPQIFFAFLEKNKK